MRWRDECQGWRWDVTRPATSQSGGLSSPAITRTTPASYLVSCKLQQHKILTRAMGFHFYPETIFIILLKSQLTFPCYSFLVRLYLFWIKWDYSENIERDVPTNIQEVFCAGNSDCSVSEMSKIFQGCVSFNTFKQQVSPQDRPHVRRSLWCSDW